MASVISRAELLRLRLRSHGLAPPGGTGAEPNAAGSGPRRAVDRLLALQGQDLPGALWSIGLRSPGSTRADVIAAFDRGELVRTWPFRGTLHVLAPEDVPWILGLTGERTVTGAARRRAALGLDDRTLTAAREAAVATLQGGPGLPRKALLAALAARGIASDRQRGYHLLWHLSVTGTLVQGPFTGPEQRFVLAADWIKRPRRLVRDEALTELVLRYLAGRGPARAADVAWWPKLPLRDVRAGLDGAGGRLVAFTHAGERFWGHRETLDRVAADRPPRTLPLPGFDEFLLGYGDRSAALAPEHASAIVPGGNGVFRPTVLHRGRVVGVWSRRTTTRRTTVTATGLAGPLPRAATSGLRRALRGYGRFLGTEVALVEGGD